MGTQGSKSTILYLFVYLLIRAAGVVVSILPRPLAIALAKMLGVVAFSVLRAERVITMHNLREAFPEKSPAERRRIGRAAMGNLMVVGMEMLRARFYSRDRVLSSVYLDPDSEALYHQLMNEGRGVVFVGGHYCNWELLGARTAAVGYPGVGVMQNLGNPFINRELKMMRDKLGGRLAARGVALREAIRMLKEGGAIFLLADQEADLHSGIFTNFFGKPTVTFTGPASLAVRYNAPLVATSIYRERGRYRAFFERLDNPILAELPPGADEDTHIRILTESFVRWLEKQIRTDPKQYLWLHRRWESWTAGMKR